MVRGLASRTGNPTGVACMSAETDACGREILSAGGRLIVIAFLISLVFPP